jgi:hypothetical protein
MSSGMRGRPLSATIISLLLIATGVIGLVSHLARVTAGQHFPYDALWASLVSLLAIAAGVGMLRAGNWARWLSLAWIAFHVILSLFHTRFELAVHILVFAAFAYFLFRPPASEYFRRATP